MTRLSHQEVFKKKKKKNTNCHKCFINQLKSTYFLNMAAEHKPEGAKQLF